MDHRITRPALAALAALLTLTGCAASASPAAARGRITPYLPAPTGGRPVGATSLYLDDTSRADPWVPEIKDRRLMVTVWYPAAAAEGRPFPYMTAAESKLLLASGDVKTVPGDVLSRTRTGAVEGPPPAGRRHGLPLVVLSPGFSKPRATLSGLAADLASHGYVAAVVDHTYENTGETFPDGEVTTCVACELPGHDQAFWEKVSRVRSADVSFVLDRLTGDRPAWRGGGLIDPSRIAMAGHSAGGGAATTAMVSDRRIRAGIDIDGTTNLPLPESGLNRPFLFFGRSAAYRPGSGPAAATWERDWKRLTGWRRWILVNGAVHESFTDIGPLTGQLGLKLGARMTGKRSMYITRTYVRAFLDHHLGGTREPLLDHPSRGFPEVTRVRP